MRSPGVDRRGLLAGLSALAALAGCASPETERIAALTARGIVLTVNFDLGSYALRPEAREVLDPLAEAMNDPRLHNHTYEVNGHTDSTGRLGRNMALSDLRAAAVVDHLVARGVSPRRLKPQGFGPLQPLTPENPRAGVNRRVEVFAIPPQH
ncbi:OmpA family protein [Elioraea sp. Yellowstone]|jgi:outer membrane protein OmpA-like peptidoglycan-associated protein|uniref:OmpA family protein n=1 Tax=Elioraea sp. Yellowstone TaxID=2592070 RepID=UPI0013867B15|nr:OmpA family protein [Elioraea sp. Yellowstone]